jgi:hypothetical protein
MFNTCNQESFAYARYVISIVSEGLKMQARLL